MKSILSIIVLIFICFSTHSYAQKGQVWYTNQKIEFETDDEGNITDSYDPYAYTSYYLFISNDAFIHCTDDITSIYEIVDREVKDGYTNYTVISEVGNEYMMSFSYVDKKIVLYSPARNFGSTINCKNVYKTEVFKNVSLK